ncbi:MAG: hypothetical protein Edafosvirus2_99 [Edafosvirus sp.]|uniref:Uncharacterized protein n=1 Tax=Edafosvirus sp. TaxID=2487765 RepID=A0A3G4ZSN8_9VIRU|nr:MAG: hypothetical protein Edafosvirus2_99 [Edafosvirus sp.]
MSRFITNLKTIVRPISKKPHLAYVFFLASTTAGSVLYVHHNRHRPPFYYLSAPPHHIPNGLDE